MKQFLSAMDKLGLPRFQASDLEKVSTNIKLSLIYVHHLMSRYHYISGCTC